MNISEAVEAEEADEEEEDEEKRGEKKSTEPFFAPTACTIMLRSTRLRNRSSRVSYRTTKCLKKCLSLPCQLSECSESRSTRRNYYHCDQKTNNMSAAVVDFGPSRKGYFYESVGGVYYTLGKLMNFEPKIHNCSHSVEK